MNRPDENEAHPGWWQGQRQLGNGGLRIVLVIASRFGDDMQLCVWCLLRTGGAMGFPGVMMTCGLCVCGVHLTDERTGSSAPWELWVQELWHLLEKLGIWGFEAFEHEKFMKA